MQDKDLYDTVTITSDHDKKVLKGFLDEAVRCKQRIKTENEAIKDIREEAKEKLGIKPKTFNRLVKAIFNDSANEEAAEFEEFEGIYDLLYAPTNYSSDDE